MLSSRDFRFRISDLSLRTVTRASVWFASRALLAGKVNVNRVIHVDFMLVVLRHTWTGGEGEVDVVAVRFEHSSSQVEVDVEGLSASQHQSMRFVAVRAVRVRVVLLAQVDRKDVANHVDRF